jgi:hypothetical protein
MIWLLLLAEQGGALDGALRGGAKGAVIGAVVGGLVGLGYALVKKFTTKPNNDDGANDPASRK